MDVLIGLFIWVAICWGLSHVLPTDIDDDNSGYWP